MSVICDDIRSLKYNLKTSYEFLDRMGNSDYELSWLYESDLDEIQVITSKLNNLVAEMKRKKVTRIFREF